jgi:hypothetical protein
MGDTLDWFGAIIESAGDINCDGFNDMWVFGKRETINDRLVYTYYLFHGGNPMDTIPDYTIRDSIRSVINVGDMNADSFDDFVITHDGVPKYFGLYYGGPIFDTIPEYRFPVINPENINYGIPFSVVGGEDMDGDGLPDLLLGEPGAGSGFSGKAYFYGSYPTFDTIYDIEFSGYGTYPEYYDYSLAVEFLENLDGNNYLAIYEGGNGQYETRARVFLYQSASDSTKGIFDNIPEIIIGTPEEAPAYNFGSLLKNVGDMNSNGYADLVISSLATLDAYLYFGGESFDTIPDITIVPSFMILEPIGDVNNDSYPDVIVGEEPYNGIAWIYYGGPDMDGIVDMKVDVPRDVNNFGRSIMGLGDVNGDGIDDFAVGAVFDDYGYWPGVVYVYAGYDSTPTYVVDDKSISLPKHFILHQNYPNPFNSLSTIEFELPRKDIINLEIFNILGQRVAILAENKPYLPGRHVVHWDGILSNGSPAPSGVYFYRLSSKTSKTTKRMVLLK